MVIFKQKEYTQWDETDRLKQMKDSDILAEQKKKSTSGLTRMAQGAGTGALVGSVAGGLLGVKKGGIAGLGAGMIRGAKWGGALGATAGFVSGGKERRENAFYNNRLEYAQRQARRREKKDWKQNMTGREGYTY